jgi:hypothetical protein
MSKHKQHSSNVWTFIGLIALVVLLMAQFGCKTNADRKQQIILDVSWRDYKLMKRVGWQNLIITTDSNFNMSATLAYPNTTRVYLDIDPGELNAMSTDSLHPDSALIYMGKYGVPHVSYNYSK